LDQEIGELDQEKNAITHIV